MENQYVKKYYSDEIISVAKGLKKTMVGIMKLSFDETPVYDHGVWLNEYKCFNELMKHIEESEEEKPMKEMAV